MKCSTGTVATSFRVSGAAAGTRRRNGRVCDFMRPDNLYAQWVEAPIAVNSSCRSFFIKPASPEYAARAADRRAVYAIDSMFVALKHSIPTLNGFSAWAPAGWNLANPEDPGYTAVVRDWIDRHRLEGVCEFDIEQRTMKPFS